MTYRDGLKQANADLDPLAALRSRLEVLVGVQDAIGQLLGDLGIRTVLDLALSPVFALAAASGNGEAQAYPLAAVPGDLVIDGGPSDLGELAAADLSALRAFPEPSASAVRQAMQVDVVADLGRWAPYRAALQVLAAVASGADAGASPAQELVPRLGQYPTERRFYATIVLDEVAAENTVELSTAGPVDLSPALSADFGFSAPAVGARLTFEQSWSAQGFALGNLLHSLALAPGESTRIAVLDWSRRTSTATSESVSETEQLANVTTHNRAVSEVQDAVAKEVQSGFSHAESTATTEEGGGGFGLALGPLVIGGAGGAGHSTTSADSFSSSSGSRSLAASMSQKVMDATQQAASSARNRRASIVQEVSQQEQEQVSTRIVANYNHMHALTVQYFEVVELYRVAAALSEAERCLFVPMKIMEFTNALVRKYQGVLADAALDRQVRELLTTEFGSIRLTPTAPVRPLVTGLSTAVTGVRVLEAQPSPPPPGAPNAPATTPPATTPPAAAAAAAASPPAAAVFTWDRGELERVARITSSRVVRVGAPDVYLSPSTTLLGLTVSTNQSGPVITGVSLALGNGQAPVALTRTSVDWRTPTEVPIEEIASIAVTTEGAGDFRGTMTLELDYLSSRFPVTLPVAAGPNSTTTVVTLGGIEAAAELLEHLNGNRLHYNQAIWRSLDSSTVALLLAGFHYEGQPVANVIDPTPLQIAANYLVFRMPGFVARRDLAEPADEAGGAADATARAAWRKWLADKGVTFGPDASSEHLVPVPTGGVFAEAVLGRSNAAEKLDATRFWNWQDSPIPLQPPEIAAISMDSRAQPADVRPGELGAPVLNIVNPTSLPDPTGIGAILGAVQNGNMFRDMSGLAATIGLAQATGANATSAAADAVRAASANLQAEAQRDVALHQIDAQTKAAATSPSAMGGSPKNISEMGSLINAAGAQDRMSGATPAPRSGRGGGGSSGGGGAGGGPGGSGPMPGTTSGSLGTDAFNRALWGAYGAPMSDVVLADLKKPAPKPALSPFRTGIPDRLVFDSDLWDAFSPNLADLAHVNPGFGALEDLAIVITAMPGDPGGRRPTVGHRAHDMFYSGSMLKTAAMYAAYQLRAALNDLGPSLTDGTDQQVFDQVRAAFDPQIRAAVPRIAATRGISADMLTPRYESIFVVNHAHPLTFDFATGPDDSDDSTDRPASTFYANLKRMIVGSHNNSAGATIRALGYNTINGALQSGGFFRANTENGIWLAGDYNQWPTVTVDSLNDQQVKQATTCQDMARLLVLINDGDLVLDDPATHPDTGNLEMGELLKLAVPDPGARSLLNRPFEPNPAPFTVLQSKIGVGELKGGACNGPHPNRCTYSEAALVQHSSGRKFVVVWQNLVLFDADPNAWSDGLLAIANAIKKTMDAYHP
jgi:uncharacterized membrane protein YgcG